MATSRHTPSQTRVLSAGEDFARRILYARERGVRFSLPMPPRKRSRQSIFWTTKKCPLAACGVVLLIVLAIGIGVLEGQVHNWPWDWRRSSYGTSCRPEVAVDHDRILPIEDIVHTRAYAISTVEQLKTCDPLTSAEILDTMGGLISQMDTMFRSSALTAVHVQEQLLCSVKLVTQYYGCARLSQLNSSLQYGMQHCEEALDSVTRGLTLADQVGVQVELAVAAMDTRIEELKMSLYNRTGGIKGALGLGRDQKKIAAEKEEVTDLQRCKELGRKTKDNLLSFEWQLAPIRTALVDLGGGMLAVEQAINVCSSNESRVATHLDSAARASIEEPLLGACVGRLNAYYQGLKLRVWTW